MPDLTVKLQLTPDERELILKHGYPEVRLEQALRRWSGSGAIKRIGLHQSELEMLTSELSRSFNQGELGAEEEAVLALCHRLEYAETTGDGDLDILM